MIKNCIKCERESDLNFAKFYDWRFNDGARFVWDIEKAIALVNARLGRIKEGLEPLCEWEFVMPEVAEQLAVHHEIYPDHLDHVDPKYPGLAVLLERNGGQGWLLIDGHHRALRAARDGQAFIMIFLTPAEESECRLTAQEIADVDVVSQAQQLIYGRGR